MRIAPDLESFHAAPVGACTAGRSFIHFCATPELSGLVLFGRPDREDALRLARSLSLEFAPEVAPHAFYVDACHLEGVDPDAFGALVQVYRDNRARARHVYTRLGLRVPTGVEGAVVTGFYGVDAPPFPFRVLSDHAEARAWLGVTDELARRLTELVAAQRGGAAIVVALRNLLADHDPPASPEALARTLGMSARTLQRRLQEAGTSLQREQTALRIELAKKRLVETETPITVIALDLGFATPQHFSRLFRDATGLTPKGWRERARARP